MVDQTTEKTVITDYYTYQLISEFNAAFNCITYGIVAGYDSNKNSDVYCVRDITSCPNKAYTIFNKICEGMVSPIHLHDVLSDLITIF